MQYHFPWLSLTILDSALKDECLLSVLKVDLNTATHETRVQPCLIDLTGNRRFEGAL